MVVLTLVLICVSSLAYVPVHSQSNDLYNVIYSGLSSVSGEIDLKPLNLSTSMASDVRDTYFSILYESPELFYVEYQYQIQMVNNTIIKVIPSYKMTGNALANARKEYNQFVDDIVKSVPSGLSDIEKALYVHDYLAANYEYDMDLEINDAYSFFKEGKGVCQSYTLVYMAVLKKLGIEVSYAESDLMNHIWNLIKIDGKWYHVDVTWDDPIMDKPGRVKHDNFLRSDDGIKDTDHYSWNSNYPANSTRYDNYFWGDVDAPFAYVRGSWYYINSSNSTLYKYDFGTNKSTQLFTIQDMWPVVGGGSYWKGCFTGLGEYNGYLFYNTPTKVFAYDTVTGKSMEIATPNTSNGYIYYFTIKNNILTYYQYISPNDDTYVTNGSVNLDTIQFTYTVTYKVDGSVYTTQVYKEGDSIILPAAPEKPGYDFVGWEPNLPGKMPNKDLVVNAVFVKQDCRHESTHVEITEATCTSNGKKETICSICGSILSTEIIPKKDHTYEDWIIVKNPTEHEEGLKKKVCSVCKDELTEIIPKLEPVKPTAGEETTRPTDTPVLTESSATSTPKPTMGAEETHAEETNSPSPTPNVTNTPDTGIEDNEFGAA